MKNDMVRDAYRTGLKQIAAKKISVAQNLSCIVLEGEIVHSRFSCVVQESKTCRGA